MSKYSGRCDLYDSIYGGTSGWAGYFEAFEAFRERTGGKVYQEREVTVSDYNLDDVCGMNPQLSYSEETVTKTDKNGNAKEVVEKRFTYWGKEYDSLKALNKKGVYVRIEIPFETVLDLIPYYPYAIAFHARSADSETVILANQSATDRSMEDFLGSGLFKADSAGYQLRCKHELAEHYRDVVEELGRDMECRRRQINLRDAPMTKDGDEYIVRTASEIDLNHPIEWFFPDGDRPHWASPRYSSGYAIAVSERDVEDYLKDAIANDGVYIRFAARREGRTEDAE